MRDKSESHICDGNILVRRREKDRRIEGCPSLGFGIIHDCVSGKLEGGIKKKRTIPGTRRNSWDTPAETGLFFVLGKIK